MQTFVQRALLGMEPQVRLTDEQAAEWKRIKNYRVWEASRKIFLFPENWIEPALRGDKTPFFKQLESELRRQEITDDAAEQAAIHYLERVAETSALEVVSVYHDVLAEDGLDVVHVVARTRSEPFEYYHRSATRARVGSGPRKWTPWERIELDIVSDHVFFLRWERALMLAWANIEEKPNAEQPDNSSIDKSEPDDGDAAGAEPARTHLEIGVTVSERKQGRWSPPRTSRSRLSTEKYFVNKTKTRGVTPVASFNLTPQDITFGVLEASRARGSPACSIRRGSLGCRRRQGGTSSPGSRVTSSSSVALPSTRAACGWIR